MSWCQCEHASHPSVDEPGDCTQDHAYGENCDEVVEVKTHFGTFKVCRKCAEGHLKEWLRIEAAMENDE